MKEPPKANNKKQLSRKMKLLIFFLAGLAIVGIILASVASMRYSEKTATIDLGCDGRWDVVSYDKDVIEVIDSNYDEQSKCQTYKVMAVSDNVVMVSFIGSSDKITGEMRYFHVSVEDTSIEINEEKVDPTNGYQYGEYIDLGTYDGEEHTGLHDDY